VQVQGQGEHVERADSSAVGRAHAVFRGRTHGDGAAEPGARRPLADGEVGPPRVALVRTLALAPCAPTPARERRQLCLRRARQMGASLYFGCLESPPVEPAAGRQTRVPLSTWIPPTNGDSLLFWGSNSRAHARARGRCRGLTAHGRSDRLGEQVHPVESADFTLRIDHCSSCSVRIGVLQASSESARTGENWFHPDYVGRVQYCGGGLFTGNYREKSRHSGHTF